MRKTMLMALAAAAAAAIPALGAIAGSVAVTTDRDNTIYSEDGTLSNGGSVYMYSGMSGAGIRRSLMHFDIAGNVPAGSTITGVTLTLSMSRTNFFNDEQTHSLHLMFSDWGEAGSDAGSPGGMGAPAEAGDATWSHAFYNTTMWTTAGGDLDATASASQLINDVGFYSWSSLDMVGDVQSWLDSPALNYGWALLGNEVTFQSAKRFDTHENGDPSARPQLVIQFLEVPAPGGLALLALGGLVRGRRRRA